MRYGDYIDTGDDHAEWCASVDAQRDRLIESDVHIEHLVESEDLLESLHQAFIANDYTEFHAKFDDAIEKLARENRNGD